MSQESLKSLRELSRIGSNRDMRQNDEGSEDSSPGKERASLPPWLLNKEEYTSSPMKAPSRTVRAPSLSSSAGAGPALMRRAHSSSGQIEDHHMENLHLDGDDDESVSERHKSNNPFDDESQRGSDATKMDFAGEPLPPDRDSMRKKGTRRSFVVGVAAGAAGLALAGPAIAVAAAASTVVVGKAVNRRRQRKAQEKYDKEVTANFQHQNPVATRTSL